ncbi:UDP-N-acetylmuramoyl-tripeptide--D-alanyl-D-alanine ligase [Aquihabitans sp. G128]|uniref:UDP-N-acetylmuramoyl-tripeptide--D-alanyl-D- alanine ligase n=1 Tax=Aquihabitans sp. G128 TaxID=2849779 RepID=UPI001C2123C9|nr:UDP-N-acetylmuramoyl-tripeptide--D-alanyl-D-alanine ligase [Aquihabitans sp. G128]QXC61751.1 UDP-N-acetylmuramoyl-tripeptide--D-alanyl-D-alanine ligase [Aquihabitans sp. G128]
MRFTTSEIAGATGGEVFGREVTVEGATIDSRAVQPGQLFVPVVAERDGHDFIGAAVAAGAAAYLTGGPIEAATAVRVADTTAALTALGHHARTKLTGHVVGVTGSVGKTSLKDLLAAVGATSWATSASVGSFNNELGVPLTLANAPDGTELAVIEMGARGKGHIAELCAIAEPTVGIVTVVAGAHLEMFGSIDDVAVAKSELVASLAPSGTAVLNADDHRVLAMAGATEATVVTFGVLGGEVRATEVELDGELRARFTLRSPWGTAAVHLGVAGAHQVTNALGAAAAALALGAPVEAVAAGLADARLSAMRMDLVDGADGVRILDDAYNANPTSMRAGLAALAAIDAPRRFAVVGTMAELGDGADAAHAEIAAAAAEAGIELVAVAEPRYGTTPDRSAATPEEAVEVLRALGLARGHAVLVKGSRATRLERVVALLRAAPEG